MQNQNATSEYLRNTTFFQQRNVLPFVKTFFCQPTYPQTFSKMIGTTVSIRFRWR